MKSKQPEPLTPEFNEFLKTLPHEKQIEVLLEVIPYAKHLIRRWKRLLITLIQEEEIENRKRFPEEYENGED